MPTRTLNEISVTRRFSILVVLLALGGASSAAFSQTPSQPVSSVVLISERPSIAPGQEFWTGIKFQLNNGWHIYWLNPGDSGEPPNLQWHRPAGFQAGEIRWPVPKRLESFSAIDYGYEGQVLLMVPIRTAASLRPGDNIDVHATVKWVACREVCIPGRQEVALSLPVKPTAAAESSELFNAARTQLPQPLPSGWRISATSEREHFVLSVRAGHPIKQTTFFPLVPQQIENAASQEVSPFSQGVRLKLKKSDQLLKPIAELKGLLVLPSGKTYVIHAPVRVHSQSIVKPKAN